MSGLCRDCATPEIAPANAAADSRCRACGSRRLLRHAELDTLEIAHLDCDAFYASVEKRDDPSLADKPVIVGGRERGVVLACCYVARLYGVRSAMPMFKALKACPDAAVVRPDMAKYRAVGGAVRALMRETTPLVQPLSIDEAFMDLSGTQLLHGGSPAQTMVRLARRIENEVGVTVSIGLSYNKFLAKVASDLDKPRGFAIIGRAEAADFLRARPVGLIWGVGAALARRLARDGITQIGQLRALDDRELTSRYGAMGRRLGHFARGEDARQIVADEATKSISAETTFAKDLRTREDIAHALVPLCERVAERLKKAGLAASGVVLKLKTADFRLRSRSRALAAPTQLADTLTRAALALLDREIDGTAFRLVGIGAERLAESHLADPPDLFDGASQRAGRIEDAVATIRAKLGHDAIGRGSALGARPGWSRDVDED